MGFRTIKEGTTQVSSMADRYERECAFWFQIAGVFMISQGYLLTQYMKATKTNSPPKWYGWYMTTLGIIGAKVETSGFLPVIAQGVYALMQNKNSCIKDEK